MIRAYWAGISEVPTNVRWSCTMKTHPRGYVLGPQEASKLQGLVCSKAAARAGPWFWRKQALPVSGSRAPDILFFAFGKA